MGGLIKIEFADDLRINVEPKHDVNYWSCKFRVNAKSLKSPVALVGPMARDVEKHFGN